MIKAVGHLGIAVKDIDTSLKALSKIVDFQAPAMLGLSVEPGFSEEVAREISGLPEVSYVVLTIGNYDLIVEVYCRDLTHLTHFIGKQIPFISGVKQIDTLLITKSYKLSYRWSPELSIED